MKWQTAWLLVRDVLVTGTGLAIIYTQIFGRHTPSDTLLVVAIALTTPSLAAHAGALLSGPSTAGHGPPESPPSSSSHGSPPASPSQDGHGEQ